jgi:hypothetical protein
VVAKEYYLPPLPRVRALICERAGLDTRSSALTRHLSHLLFKASSPLAVQDAKIGLLKNSA